MVARHNNMWWLDIITYGLMTIPYSTMNTQTYGLMDKWIKGHIMSFKIFSPNF